MRSNLWHSIKYRLDVDVASGYVMCFTSSYCSHTFRIHAKLCGGTLSRLKLECPPYRKFYYLSSFFIEKLRLVYATLFVPWIPLCSFVCLGFSPRMILIAKAIFVGIVDTKLSVSSKAYVLIYLPCLESVTEVSEEMMDVQMVQWYCSVLSLLTDLSHHVNVYDDLW